MDSKKKINGIVFVALMIAGLSYAAQYSLPYVKYVFYDAMKEASGSTNTQLGLMMSIYGFGNIVFNIVGGFVADKLDYKKCIVISLLGTTALSIWLALNPTTTTMFIVWGLLVITTLFLFNPPVFKLTRMVVPDELIGDSVGVFSFFQAVGYIIINFIALYIYNKSIEVSTSSSAFSNVVWTYGFFTLLMGVAAFFVFKRLGKTDMQCTKEDNSAFTIKQLAQVMKEPGLWMMIIAAFCVYSASLTASYFTPYFSEVFGVAITFAGALGIINQYGGRLVSPILGKIAVKTKYVSRIVIVGLAMIFILVLAVMVLPKDTPIGVLMAITLLAGAAATMFMNISLAMSPEADVPRNSSGAALGLYAAIAYSPDMFQHTIFGHWLDTYGNAGFTYMFIYTLVLVVIGAIASTLLYKRSKRSGVLEK